MRLPVKEVARQQGSERVQKRRRYGTSKIICRMWPSWRRVFLTSSAKEMSSRSKELSTKHGAEIAEP